MSQSGKRFQKYKEDFTCNHCGVAVAGNGYTNHCPECLWSRHVDINPGDRSEQCQGMMQPIAIEVRGQEKKVLQRCVICGFERKNKLSESDSLDAVLAIMKNPSITNN